VLGGQHLINAKNVGNQLVEILQSNFNYVSYVCGFVVFVFLWLSFGSIELALLSFLPLAVSWIWILGLMQLLGIQFNIVNIILATFIFGQGDDYTIFITEGLVYEYATGRRRLSSYRRSVVLLATLMFIGIGTLILAKHPALRSLAEVTIVGMGTVVVMAYYLPPLVFRWLTQTQKTHPRPLPVEGGENKDHLPPSLNREGMGESPTTSTI
jgi:predicted RND superfamily exporter protein